MTERGEFDRAVAMLEEALAISTRAGNERDVSRGAGTWPTSRRRRGTPTGRSPGSSSSFLTSSGSREPALSAEIIGAFARLALARGEARRGVVLGSRATASMPRWAGPTPCSGNGGYLESVRPLLGDAEFEAAKAEGQAMSMSEALGWAADT